MLRSGKQLRLPPAAREAAETAPSSSSFFTPFHKLVPRSLRPSQKSHLIRRLSAFSEGLSSLQPYIRRLSAHLTTAYRGLRRLLWWVFILLVLRKSWNGHWAVTYVRTCWHTLVPEIFTESDDFDNLVRQLSASRQPPPAILMLNRHALPMTYNWLCNTAHLAGVHERVLMVTLDRTARNELAHRWPHIRQFYWPSPCIQNRFKFGDPSYQAMQTLRSSFAAALADVGISFWMMQQDTFWRESVFDLGFEDNADFDILFDQIGATPSSARSEWINGANFFVRGNERTADFFRRVGVGIWWLYAPDMGLMIWECAKHNQSVCAYMPHKYVNCWEWLTEGNRAEPPYLMQLDCETDSNSGKLEEMKKFGFYFLNEEVKNAVNGNTTSVNQTSRFEPDLHTLQNCNQTAVELARRAIKSGSIRPRSKQSWARAQFTIYWQITDFLLSLPLLGAFFKTVLPALGFYMLITV